MTRQLQQAGKHVLKNLDAYMTMLIALVFGTLGIVYQAINPIIIQSSILATLTILAFTILRNRTDLEQITKNLPPNIKIYSQQEEAYKFLEECIKHHSVRDAVIIQYSCNSAMNILRTILARGATVTLYIEDEQVAASIGAYEQVDRIAHWQKSYYTVLAEVLRPNCLKLRKYQVPGSISGIRINLGTKQILCMGWYIYEHVDGTNRSPAYTSDTAQISGHDVATMVVWSGTEQFDALNRTFSIVERNYQMNSQEIVL